MGPAQASIVSQIEAMPIMGILASLVGLALFIILAFNFRDIIVNFTMSLGIKANKRWQENFVFEFGEYDYILTKINNTRLYFLRIIDGIVSDIEMDLPCSKFLNGMIICKGRFKKL